MQGGLGWQVGWARRGSNGGSCDWLWQGNMRGPRGQSETEEDTLKHFEQIIIIVQKYGARKNLVKTSITGLSV